MGSYFATRSAFQSIQLILWVDVLLSVKRDPDTEYILSVQPGAKVYLRDCTILKQGLRVRRSEELALRLVGEIGNIPVPEVYFASYQETTSEIAMSFVPGKSLDYCWNTLNDCTKERICRETWAFIYAWRQIPKPGNFDRYLCLADGSESSDVLITPLAEEADEGEIDIPLRDDEDVRQQIALRYYHYCGRKYTKEQLLEMLPRSKTCVFTHGDVAPRNIMVDEKNDFKITGIIDWELAGWYPEYWEYINIHKPSMDKDWQIWMEKTAIEKWNISGINAARKVLL